MRYINLHFTYFLWAWLIRVLCFCCYTWHKYSNVYFEASQPISQHERKMLPVAK